MPNFENELCKGINSSFGKRGIAYRRKQARYTDQVFDILVDNPYSAIECKSIDYRSQKKLYFSQHFSDNQIPRESEFLDKSGRNGFLAIELRRGRGKKKKYLLYGWTSLKTARNNAKGIDLTDNLKWLSLNFIAQVITFQ